MYIIEQLRERVKKQRIEDADGVKAELKKIIAEIMAGQQAELDLSGAPAVLSLIHI